MTTADCSHYTVDESAYCDHCRDAYYVGKAFTMNGQNYTVWAWYGDDSITGEVYYSCRLDSGMGSIYITTNDIDGAL